MTLKQIVEVDMFSRLNETKVAGITKADAGRLLSDGIYDVFVVRVD